MHGVGIKYRFAENDEPPPPPPPAGADPPAVLSRSANPRLHRTAGFAVRPRSETVFRRRIAVLKSPSGIGGSRRYPPSH